MPYPWFGTSTLRNLDRLLCFRRLALTELSSSPLLLRQSVTSC